MHGSAPTLGELLCRLRLAARMTQRALAEAAAVSVRTLRDIEHDRVSRPHLPTLIRLSQALRLSPPDHRTILALARDQAPTVSLAPQGLCIDVLGPLAVRRAGAGIAIGAHKQRLLLGLLALHPGRPVRPEAIAEFLWPDRPPRTYPSLVHTYIARLRGALAPHPIALTRGGYQLALAGLDCDALRFEEHVRQAGQHPEEALHHLTHALRCWRGPMPAELCAHPAASALTRLRVSTGLSLGDLCVESGRYADAIDPLRDLVEAEPLHEGLHARLMLALAGAGQQAAALELFAAVKARLADELGVAPGPELADAHMAVLRQELPRRNGAVPAQLPADLADFTGREPELAKLASLTQPHERAMVVCAVTGPPGVGKTALAVHWAHRIAARFPDGQLYLDLRGFSAEPPLRPIEALRPMLMAYGVAPQQIPADASAAAGLLRTLLSARRTLLVLDNAADAEQIRPLLPGSATCLVLVTSRDRLDGLVATAGARRLGLDVLDPRDAAGLLARITGAAPEAVAELAELCGRLPLALRIAGAQLTGDGTPIAEYVAGLRAEHRLARLSAGDDAAAAVRTAFDRSYAALSTSDRRLFRLVGWAPGTDFAAETASALIDGPAADGLERLTRAHLVQRRPGGRFGMHDLLRLYASERCRAEDGADERDAAHLRALDAYQMMASKAAHLLFPQMMRLHRPPSTQDKGFDDRAVALAWLDAEHANMMAAIRAAAGLPWVVVGHLANALRGYLEHRRHLDDWLAVAETGRAAFAATGDPRGEAVGRMSLAIAHGCRTEFAASREGFDAVLAASREHGWRDVEAVTLNNLGYLSQHIGELGPAVEFFQSALTLYREIAWEVGQASSLSSLGSIHYGHGQFDDAWTYLTEALDIAQRIEALGVEALVREHLGKICHARGQSGEALQWLERALTSFRQVGNRHGEATVLNDLAMVHLDAGEPDRAAALATQARTLASEIGYAMIRVAALNTLGAVSLRRGDAQTALARYEQARDLAGPLQQRYHEVDAMLGLAAAHSALGEAPRALTAARGALHRARQRGYRALQTRARELLARIKSVGTHGRGGHVVDVPDTAGRGPHERARG